MQSKQFEKALAGVIYSLYQPKVYAAAKYLSDKLVVRATRLRYKGKVSKIGNMQAVLVIGKPNYEQRDFIKKCKKAGEPFPVKKIQLKLTK